MSIFHRLSFLSTVSLCLCFLCWAEARVSIALGIFTMKKIRRFPEEIAIFQVIYLLKQKPFIFFFGKTKTLFVRFHWLLCYTLFVEIVYNSILLMRKHLIVNQATFVSRVIVNIQEKTNAPPPPYPRHSGRCRVICFVDVKYLEKSNATTYMQTIIFNLL